MRVLATAPVRLRTPDRSQQLITTEDGAPILVEGGLLATEPVSGRRAPATLRARPAVPAYNALLVATGELGRAVAGTIARAVGVEVEIGAGVKLPTEQLAAAGVTVSETQEGSSWTLTVPVGSDGSTMLGNVHGRATGAPIIGQQSVTIRAVIVVATRVYRVPLVTNGIAHAGRLSVNQDGAVYQLSGVDGGGRIDGVRVTARVPAGHGRRRRTILRDALDAANISLPVAGIRDSLPTGPRTWQPVQVIDQELMQWARALLAPEGRGLRVDRLGQLTAPLVGWRRRRSLYPPIIRPLLSGGLAEDHPADRPSVVEVTATLLPRAGAECDVETEVKVSTSETSYAPRAWYYQQSPTTGINPPDRVGSGPGVAEFQPTARVTTITERQCGVEISRTIITEGWYSPRAARYVLDPTATERTIDSYLPRYIYDEGAEDGDNASAYAWPSERFVPVSIVTSRREYAETGEHVRTVTERYGWVLLRTAAKRRLPGVTVPWEQIAYSTLWGAGNLAPHDMGNGDLPATQAMVGGPFTRGEQFRLQSVEVEEIQPTATRQREGARVTTSQPIARDGLEYWYQDGTVSRDRHEALQVVQVDTEQQLEAGEGGHQTLVLPADFEGRLLPPELSQVLLGHLPWLPYQEPDPPASVDGQALPVDRTGAQRVVREASCGGDYRPRRETIQLEYANDEDELAAAAERAARAACSSPVSVTVPLGIHIEPGQWRRVLIRPIGYDEEIEVETASHSFTREGWVSVAGGRNYHD